MVDVVHVADGRVGYVYVSTGVEQETDLSWFLRTYEYVPPIDPSGVRLAGLGVVAVVAVVLAAMFGALDLEDQSMLDALDAPVYAVEIPVAAGASVEPTAPPAVSPPTSSTARLVVVPDAPAARVGNAHQVTPTDPPPPSTLPPVPAAGDCAAWMDVFRHYGATEREVAWFLPIIRRESTCGTDFINDNTSDRYVCQLNGVHSQPGYAFGTYYGEGGWMLELFGLPGGRSVTTQAEASTVLAVPACLWLLRGGTTPDSFAGAYHWNPR